ncbi:ABC transporter permease [Streptomyces griseorubiginosus]|uniref:ABC transporter permease n=1 Tax=Streptomyces griseorubiginosus TaxID=67304 RepID=UPI003655CDF2
MSSYFLFLLLGLGSGAVYGILALGLVLKHRSAGVVDFGHGAVAMFGAYVFLDLRDRGTLQFPWIGLPHAWTFSSSGLSTPVAMAAALVYSALFGLLLYVVVHRPLQHAAPLTRVCASVGVMLGLQAIAVLNFGTEGRSTNPILPTSTLSLAGVTFPVDRLYFAGLVVVLAAVLAAVYRFTPFGLATRAAAENDAGAALIGLSAHRIAAVNWVIASVMAAAAGILIAPISTLDPSSYTLFIVPALGVALVARFSSFAVTAAAGLVLGMAQSEITKLLTVWTWLPQQGVAQGLPFLAILIALPLLTKRLAARGDLAELRTATVGRPVRPALTAVLTFGAGLILLAALQGSLRSAMINSIGTGVICLSLVVLTGYVGQVSLAQMSLAGMSAFLLSHLSLSWGVPFPLSFLLAALGAVPVGIVVGLPALRIRGVHLAIITLAAGYTLDALVFNATSFTGGLAGRDVPSPQLFGLDLGIARGDDYPRLVFGAFALLIAVLAGWMVARTRLGAPGRMFLAVRSNERAAAAAGINVSRAKLSAFALSSFVAGIGGCLLAYQQGTVSPSQFAVFNSLSLLAVVYVAGVGRITGAVMAGVMFAPAGLFVSVLDRWFHIGQYQGLVAGIALTLTAVQNPDGVSGQLLGPKGPVAAVRRLGTRMPASKDTGAPLPPPDDNNTPATADPRRTVTS